MLVTKLAPIDLHVYTEYIQNANIDRSWHFNPNCRRFWFLYSKIELKCTTKTGTIRKLSWNVLPKLVQFEKAAKLIQLLSVPHELWKFY